MTGDPLAIFYERLRLVNESPSIYAVELEATLRTVEERMNNRLPLANRNSMLTQQFMRGVGDEKITNRLAPMRPRDMTFRELQVELRQIEREQRAAALLQPKTVTKAQSSQHTSKGHSQPQNVLAQPAQQASPQQTKQHKPEAAAKSQSPTDNPPMNRQQAQNADVIQDLIHKVEQLSRLVEGRVYRPYAPSDKPTSPQQPTDRRAFICHRCGQEGHIARGCRNIPLNFQGPRSEGKPEARSPAQN